MTSTVEIASTYERNADGSLTIEGKVQEMQAHIEGKCPGCGSGWHDRYPVKRQCTDCGTELPTHLADGSLDTFPRCSAHAF